MTRDTRRPRASGAGRVDLHAHTTYSDGELTPAALVDRAVARGIAGLAVTDHDSVDGIAEARATAAGRLGLVAGIELSTCAGGADLHVLGYFVDPERPALRERLERFRRDRLERARQIVARLCDLGLHLEFDALVAAAGPGVIGRPHVAEALVRGGMVESVEVAFRRYLGSQGSAFVPRPAFLPEEAIRLIDDSDGVAVLAHPGSQVSAEVIESLVRVGLGGLEVWHPHHGPDTVKRLRSIAARLELVETGGSDFHGEGRGVDLGAVIVPLSALEKLKRTAGISD